ncbi:hypothetical protein CDL15_Pgr024113 [Punica granatum]|uniref:Uncharacterized protein n=1 Tax=Punica granatum TaxID=22663 RepID=A0A218XW38_PUNGR|nr:hypothetical protein CDL15_Pgr024113 [Punica granatum]PKI61935.1 hypothetical protein CRG98_017661 [Punica granatum]
MAVISYEENGDEMADKLGNDEEQDEDVEACYGGRANKSGDDDGNDEQDDENGTNEKDYEGDPANLRDSMVVKARSSQAAAQGVAKVVQQFQLGGMEKNDKTKKG